MNLRVLFSTLLICCLVFLAAPIAHAQLASSDIAVSISPEQPGPYQPVTITIDSYATNLSTAAIAWDENGKPVSLGVGTTTYTFNTKDIGVPTTITITVTPLGSSPIVKNIVITPMDIDILWEATDATVPPLYRGKAFPSSEGKVKFVGMPNMLTSAKKFLSASDLLYTWTRNYDTTTTNYADNAYTITPSLLNNSEQIHLVAQSRDGKNSAAQDLSLTTSTPKILWYELSPLYGPEYEKALDTNYTVSGNEITILAQPYFFSPKELMSSDLRYEWNLNGQTIDTPTIPNVLYLHRDDKTTGTASISLSMRNVRKLFQEAQSSLNIKLQ